jgi:hypothetical protein
MWISEQNKLPYQGSKKSLIGLKRNHLSLGTIAVGEHGVEQREAFIQLRPVLVHNMKVIAPSTDYDRSKTTGDFETFQLCG